MTGFRRLAVAGVIACTFVLAACSPDSDAAWRDRVNESMETLAAVYMSEFRAASVPCEGP